jgi:hypothetical protein
LSKEHIFIFSFEQVPTLGPLALCAKGPKVGTCSRGKVKLPHSVPKGPKSGLVQGKKVKLTTSQMIRLTFLKMIFFIFIKGQKNELQGNII